MTKITCPKCGQEVDKDTIACIHCGWLFENSGLVTVTNSTTNQAGSSIPPLEESSDDNKGKLILIVICIFILGIIFIPYLKTEEQKRYCEYYDCDNLKEEYSTVCSQHQCTVFSCHLRKYSYLYCYDHFCAFKCKVEECDNYKVDGEEYCLTHACEARNCYKLRVDEHYCLEHQINLCEILITDDRDSRVITNSAGGIELTFKAKNNSEKKIKYVRFYADLYNAVGDKVKDEIKRTSSVYVEFTGPVNEGANVNIDEKIIGYNEDCTKIFIKDMEIIYMDGTSHKGEFNKWIY